MGEHYLQQGTADWVKPSARLAQTFVEHGDAAGDGWAIGIAPFGHDRFRARCGRSLRVKSRLGCV